MVGWSQHHEVAPLPEFLGNHHTVQIDTFITDHGRGLQRDLLLKVPYIDWQSIIEGQKIAPP